MKVACLDGGGVFGFAQAQILTEAQVEGKFDCYVGTSIGSAVAAAMAAGLGDKLPSFFDEWMPKVFEGSLIRKLNPWSPKYSDAGLNEALVHIFGGRQFGSAALPLFVTAARIGDRSLKVFYSGDTQDSSMLLWEVIRSATAAESYFSPWNGFADGGVFANNPSMVAVAAACKVLGAKIEDLEVLSIGTGNRTAYTNGTPKSLFGWGKWLLDALLDGASDKMHEYFVRSMPVKKHTRIQFAGNAEWKMDSVEDMRKAELAWKLDIQNAVDVVKAF